MPPFTDLEGESVHLSTSHYVPDVNKCIPARRFKQMIEVA